jgi:hypothetical protein
MDEGAFSNVGKVGLRDTVRDGSKGVNSGAGLEGMVSAEEVEFAMATKATFQPIAVTNATIAGIRCRDLISIEF